MRGVGGEADPGLAAAVRGAAGAPWRVCLALLLLCLPRAGAQPGGDAPLDRPPRFEHLTDRDGLSQVTVQGIVQDRLGFMWFATYEGLNRFDGHDLRIYQPDPDDPGSLSGGNVLTLHEGRSGTLWAGTVAGLERFDRHRDRFTHFRHDGSDATSLSHDLVRALHEDRSGALWVGTERGLDRFDPAAESFLRHAHDPTDPASLGSGPVHAVYQDRSGTLWVGTESGLSRLDRPRSKPAGERPRFRRYVHRPGDGASLAGGVVWAIFEDRAGTLWVGTELGLSRLEPGPGGTPDRLVSYRHDPRDPHSLGAGVQAIVEDRSGTLWLGTEGGGLHRLVPERQHFIRYRHDSSDPGSLGHDYVRSLHEDRTGILWIGTWAAGVSRLDPNHARFLHYRHDPSDPRSLSQEQVAAIHEDRAGNLWVGTFGGLNRVAAGPPRADRAGSRPRRAQPPSPAASPASGANVEFVHYRHDPADPSSLSNDVVVVVADDRAGGLWVGTLGGLNRLEPPLTGRASGTTGERFTAYLHDPKDPSSLSHDIVFAILEDRSGTLWVGTWGGGLDRWHPDSGPLDGVGFTHHRHDPSDPSSLAGNRVRYLLEDRFGALWIGTSTGLSRRDPSPGRGAGEPSREGFVNYRHDPADPTSLGQSAVQAIFEDRGGDLWFGTAGGGLNRLDRDSVARASFSRFTEADGLANNHIYGILEDDGGRLWLSTNRGLSRFDPASGRFTNYDVGDGLQGFEFSQTAALRGAGGMMYFGGVHGLNAFHPSWFTTSTAPPPVVLTAFHVTPQGGRRKLSEREAPGGLAAPYLETVELGHRENFFSFEFAALSYTRPDKSRYAYRLEGLDAGWIDAGDRRYAAYTSVPPGDYVFRVKAANRDGVWNEEGATLEISIRLPFWATWWFRGAAFATLAGLLWSGHALRLRVQEQRAERDKAAQRKQLIAELTAKNTELERFTYSVSHDLKSPLVTIQGFLGFLERDVKSGDAERVAGDVGRIRGAASKMQRLIDDLLELSQIGRKANPPEDVALAELAGEVVEMLDGAITENAAEVTIAPDLPVVLGDRTRLHQLLQNLVQNALQYMGDQAAPRIEVGTRRGDGDKPDVIYVRDNGAGIAPGHQEKIFELFQRLDAGTEGTGVGLALVKRIVEVHDGKVWVESERAGRGATFCFTLSRGRQSEDGGWRR